MAYLTERELWLEGAEFFGSRPGKPGWSGLGLCRYLQQQFDNGRLTYRVFEKAHELLMLFRPSNWDGGYWWGGNKSGNLCRATACGFLAAQAEARDDDLRARAQRAARSCVPASKDTYLPSASGKENDNG